MTDTPQVLLAHHLKALKLPTFLREYDKVARSCAAEGVEHPGYLLRLTELELIERERHMVERRIKEAKFPAVKRSGTRDRSHRLKPRSICGRPLSRLVDWLLSQAAAVSCVQLATPACHGQTHRCRGAAKASVGTQTKNAQGKP